MDTKSMSGNEIEKMRLEFRNKIEALTTEYMEKVDPNVICGELYGMSARLYGFIACMAFKRIEETKKGVVNE